MYKRQGEKVFILGGNGCGKTTLFRILTGKCPQDAGEYEYGTNVTVGSVSYTHLDVYKRQPLKRLALNFKIIKS